MAGRVARIAAVLARLSSHDVRRRPGPDASRSRLLRVEGLEDRNLLAVSLAASPASVWEQSSLLSTYTFTRTGDLTAPLTVNFSVAGTATYETDYVAIEGPDAYTFSATTGTVTFAANSNKALVLVDPTADAVAEVPPETVVLEVIAGAGYTIGSPKTATVTIWDDQQSQVVQPSTTSVLVDPLETFSFDVNYSTTDNVNKLGGLGLNMYFDSTKLSWQDSITNADLDGFLDFGSWPYLSDDTTENGGGDGDPDTDKCVITAWVSGSSAFPNVALPVMLYTAYFTATDQATSATQINFEGSSLANGYLFQSTPVAVDFNVVGPTADVGGPYTVAEGGSILLSAAATTHPTQAVNTLRYEWDLDNNGTYELNDINLTTADFSAALLDGGTGASFDHTVKLRVTDANLISSGVNGTVHVDNLAPTAAMAGPADGFQGVRGQNRTFIVSADDVSTADLANVTYTITWGDGTADTVVSGPGAGTPVSHAFATAASFAPSVVALDKDGGTSGSAAGATQTIGIFEKQGPNYALGGTADANTVVVSQSGRPRQLTATLDATPYGPFYLASGGKLLVFAQDGTDAITVNASASTDRLEFNQLNSSLLVLNGAAIDTSGFETWSLDGKGGSDTLVGPGTSNTWALTGNAAGTVNGSIAFTGIERLVGGTSTDFFQLPTSSSLTVPFALVDGGGGGGRLDYSAYGRAIALNLATSTAPMINRYQNITGFTGSTGFRSTLRAGNGTNNWVIDGANAGSINAASFTGFTDLVGGRGPDSFAVETGGSVTGAVDGGTGCDVIDYSGRSTNVVVSLASGAATDLGLARNFRMVVGGTGEDNFTSGNGPTVLLGGGGIDVLQGGAGRDLLIGGLAADTLNGGAGDDILFGGTTAFFNEGTGALDVRTLDAVLQQWNRPVSFEARIARLSTMITPDKISDDAGAVDHLWGDTARDWFLYYSTDVLEDADPVDELPYAALLGP